MRSGSISIGFGGDLLIDRDFAEELKQDGQSPFKALEEIAPVIKSFDVIMVNLEGPFSEGTPKLRKSISLRNHIDLCKWIDGIRNGPVVVCNLGNNHIMDFGPDGLIETKRALAGCGAHSVGAGLNDSEVDRELIVSCKGWKIAVLSLTSAEDFVGSEIASSTSPGCFDWRAGDAVLDRVASLAKQVDCVVVQLHWGHEFFEYPSDVQVAFARKLISAGANFVVGHHSHIVQGVEAFSNGAIFYSLGHFYVSPFRDSRGFVQEPHNGAREFMLPECVIDDKGKVKVTMRSGGWGKDEILRLYQDAAQNAFAQKVDRLSAPLKSRDYCKFWKDYSLQRPLSLKRARRLSRLTEVVRSPVQSLRRMRSRINFSPGPFEERA